MTEEELSSFLSECSEKFKTRFTVQDIEYKRLTGPSGRMPPPVIPDWPADRNRFQNRHQNYQVTGNYTFFLILLLRECSVEEDLNFQKPEEKKSFVLRFPGFHESQNTEFLKVIFASVSFILGGACELRLFQ